MESAALILAAALACALVGAWAQAASQARVARLALLERRLAVLERYTCAMESAIEVNVALAGIPPRRARELLPLARGEADALFEPVALALHLFGDDVAAHFEVLQEEVLANVRMLSRVVAAEGGAGSRPRVDHRERHDRLQESMRAAHAAFGEYVARDRHAGLSWRRRLEARSEAGGQGRGALLRPRPSYRAGSSD